jgi:hypothetical protein
MLRCRILGHRFRFTSSGPEMRWRCQRAAARAAPRFDREDRDDLGRRALQSP